VVADIDVPALAILMPGPGSFTGEDVAELQLPGNPMLLEEVAEGLVARAIGEGLAVRRAEAGEFTYRAWRSGRLSLDQAEGIAATIAATSDAELDAANLLAEGRTGDALRKVSQRLARTLARIEAGIDFADEEDVVVISTDEVVRGIERIDGELASLIGASSGEETVDARPRITLRGPANAGKSTLFNAMLSSARVVTHEAAGTTRDAVAAPLDLQGVEVLLVDTPGDEDSVSGAAIAAEQESDLTIWCDPHGAEGGGDLQVWTKRDLSAASPLPPAGVCAFERDDVAKLLTALTEAMAARQTTRSAAGVSLRQRSLITSARHACEEARCVAIESDTVDGGLNRPAEAAALLRAALDDLGAITEEIPPDDVLGLVFAGFCIGK